MYIVAYEMTFLLRMMIKQITRQDLFKKNI